jgi:mRNA interferase MazF
MVNQRDILLVPFPFSDQSGKKVRPVLVLSNNIYNRFGNDIIVCAITSSLKPIKYSFIIDEKSLEAGKLYEKSSIKVDTLLKINKSLIIKNIGTINKTAFQKIMAILEEIFEEKD